MNDVDYINQSNSIFLYGRNDVCVCVCGVKLIKSIKSTRYQSSMVIIVFDFGRKKYIFQVIKIKIAGKFISGFFPGFEILITFYQCSWASVAKYHSVSIGYVLFV